MAYKSPYPFGKPTNLPPGVEYDVSIDYLPGLKPEADQTTPPDATTPANDIAPPMAGAEQSRNPNIGIVPLPYDMSGRMGGGGNLFGGGIGGNQAENFDLEAALRYLGLSDKDLGFDAEKLSYYE